MDGWMDGLLVEDENEDEEEEEFLQPYVVSNPRELKLQRDGWMDGWIVTRGVK